LISCLFDIFLFFYAGAYCINFPLRTVFLYLLCLDMLCSIFIYFKTFLHFPFDVSIEPLVTQKILFNIHVFVQFLKFPLLNSNFIPLWSEKTHNMTLVFVFNLQRLILWSNIWSALESFPCAGQKSWILQLLNETLCKCVLGPFCLKYHLTSMFIDILSCWSKWEVRVLNYYSLGEYQSLCV
jgi:hypothetical protein